MLQSSLDTCKSGIEKGPSFPTYLEKIKATSASRYIVVLIREQRRLWKWGFNKSKLVNGVDRKSWPLKDWFLLYRDSMQRKLSDKWILPFAWLMAKWSFLGSLFTHPLFCLAFFWDCNQNVRYDGYLGPVVWVLLEFIQILDKTPHSFYKGVYPLPGGQD